MPKIRIVALDLDGTLLDSAKNLSQVNRAALEALAARDIAVVPTTGRFFDMMPESVRSLSFVRYAITVNGAQVEDRLEKRMLVEENIPLAMALEIMAYLDGFDVIYDCYQDNWGHMTKSLQDKAADYTPDEHYLKMVRAFREPCDDLKEYLRARGRGIQKIMLFARQESVRVTIREGLKARFPELSIAASTVNNLELNIKNAHKGVALKHLAEALGCGLENCMAFGDGANDLTMIQAAGVGVAMANACPEVLAAANYVTLSNDADGVAAALKHFELI